MRALLPAACLLLASCKGPEVIRFGRGSEGKPPAEIWLAKKPKTERPEDPAGPAPGTPVSGPPKEVYEGPVTVGLRKDGGCVVAGKAVRDAEAAARLAYVRGERQKAGSPDVQEMTVLAEPQVPMDRIFDAMSAGHNSGFTKIGWRLEPSIPMPEPETAEAALPPDEGRLVVSISVDGAFRLAGGGVGGADLGARLAEEVAVRKGKGQPTPSLTLLAERGAPPLAVKAVLDACESAGITSVALGTPVAVAGASGPPRSADLDINELYRNWRLGFESRDVDFSQGPPEYWYFALYHAFLDDHATAVDAMLGWHFNGKRVRVYGDLAAQRIGDMAYLLTAADPERAKALGAVAEEYRQVARQASERQMDLNLSKMRVGALRDRVNKEFPPSSVSFPADVKVDPPKRETEETKP